MFKKLGPEFYRIQTPFFAHVQQVESLFNSVLDLTLTKEKSNVSVASEIELGRYMSSCDV